MKIRIWHETITPPYRGRAWMWHYHVTAPNVNVRGAALTHAQAVEGVQRAITRIRDRQPDPMRRLLDNAHAATRPDRGRPLIWRPGRGLTA